MSQVQAKLERHAHSTPHTASEPHVRHRQTDQLHRFSRAHPTDRTPLPTDKQSRSVTEQHHHANTTASHQTHASDHTRSRSQRDPPHTTHYNAMAHNAITAKRQQHHNAAPRHRRSRHLRCHTPSTFASICPVKCSAAFAVRSCGVPPTSLPLRLAARARFPKTQGSGSGL